MFPIGSAEGFPAHEPANGSPKGEPPERRAARLRSLDAIRSALRGGGATLATILAAAADELAVEELVFVYEIAGRIRLAAHPGEDRPATFPRGLRSELAALDRGLPPTDTVVERLAVVSGVRSAHVTAAFTAFDRVEVVLAGGDREAPEPVELAVVGRAIALARDLLDGRDRIVDARTEVVRDRWASEIHDGVTQSVTAAYLELHRLAQRAGIDPGSSAALEEASEALRASLFDLRGVLFDLTDREPADATRTDRARAYVRGIAERWKLEIDTSLEGDLEAIDDASYEVARQVVREAIANAAKHADATTIGVTMRADAETFVVEIVDDGRGFDPEEVRQSPGHLGIRLIRDRVAEAGGTFRVEAAPGSGTRVHAELPRAPART